MHPSVKTLWNRYCTIDSKAPAMVPIAYHFCDNEEDAATCLALVLSGRKRATAASVAELRMAGDPIPRPGDFAIVTDWAGIARAVVRTYAVEIRKFAEVDEHFARAEGEGDRTLSWWRSAHKDYYARVLAGTPFVVDDELEIACEHFELVFVA